MTKKSISKTQGISKILKNSNSVLKELETADKYSEQLDSLARLSLEQEDVKIDVQIYVKVTPKHRNEKESGAGDLLKALRESKDPETFVNALSNIDESIHDHKDGHNDPKYYEAQLDSVDNTTFLCVVDKLLQHYKSRSNQLLIKLKSLL